MPIHGLRAVATASLLLILLPVRWDIAGPRRNLTGRAKSPSIVCRESAISGKTACAVAGPCDFMKRLTFAIVAFALALARPAAATTRLAVFIIADDAPLSDNLTEVAISRLAEKRGYELLGLRELEARLNELSKVKSEGLRVCLAAPACISEVGATTGVERLVIGDVRHEGAYFRLDLALVDGKTGALEARLSRDAPDLDQLISAVQSGVLELVPDNVDAVAAPVARVESPLPAGPAASPRAADTPEREKKQARSFMPYIAYGTAALAVVAFSAAAVTGTIGTARPTGEGRAEVQADLERREDYASLANGLFVTGGVLAGASAVAFIVPWE